MAATPRYSTRAELPVLVEIGRATRLTCPLYADGAAVAPSAATVTLYDAAEAVIVTAAADVSSGVAEYALGAQSAAPSSRWRVEWSITVPTAPDAVVLSSTVYVVRRRLYPTIADADVGKRVPSLALTFAGRPTIVDSYSDAIEEADTEVQRLLIQADRRPWLVMEPWALRETWLCYTIAIIYEGLVAAAAEGEPYGDLAARWRERADMAFKAAQSQMDWDQDGDADSTERTALRPAGVWLC